MKKRTVGIVAGVLGVSLLAGGTTLALWSDQAELDGGEITTGNLLIEANGTPEWYDFSPATTTGWLAADGVFTPTPTAGAGTVVFPNEFGLVPGDLVEYAQTFNLTATGDNIVANVSIDPAAIDAVVPAALQPYVTVGIAIFDEDDVLLGSSTTTELEFAVPDTNTDPGQNAQYTVKVRVGFDGAAADREGVLSTIDFTTVPITLEQVRPALIP
ncbi:alternate-type signal peptide domain-containing protein [Agromyces atrinae]|uniref:alternate-type signal peptide domain-containing protein n=1 Tax=Agromyces atrinae TaxID=592376 RepID=UPI001F56B29F|nr:alternate-type signal peptide domain-containing protein [Agromyces atrinae]MCI2956789.1 alternate-type signal peptide domain-containing protein [Agromyces atrinae]